MKKTGCLVLILSGLWAGLLEAQINSPAGRTLFARTFQWRSDFRYIRLSKLFLDGEEITNESNQEADVLVWENFFVYGLRRDTTVIAVVPYIHQDLRSVDAETGFGDPMFLIQYDGFYKKNRPGGFTRLAGFFGVKTPIGQEPFSTGSVDFVMGSIYTHWQNRWFLSASAQYVATTEGDEIEMGDAFRYDASVMYRWFTYPEWKDLFLVIELNGQTEARASRQEGKISDSGGHTIFVSPGIEFFVRPNVVLELSLQIPALQNLNGLQLGRNYSLVAGFRYVY